MKEKKEKRSYNYIDRTKYDEFKNVYKEILKKRVGEVTEEIKERVEKVKRRRKREKNKEGVV